jgi:hypothetical protein
MALTREEKQRVHDNRLKIQAVAKSLHRLEREEIPHFEEIESCLEETDKSLASALEDADSAD